MLRAECWLLRAGRRIGLVRILGRGGVRCGRGRRPARWRSTRGWSIGHGGHGAFRIQQMILAGAQSQLDERSRVGHGLALPAVVRLVAAHGFFAGLVPGAGSFSAEVVLADQGFLNGLGSLGVDFLLAAGPRRFFSRGAPRSRRGVSSSRGSRRMRTFCRRGLVRTRCRSRRFCSGLAMRGARGACSGWLRRRRVIGRSLASCSGVHTCRHRQQAHRRASRYEPGTPNFSTNSQQESLLPHAKSDGPGTTEN